MKRLRTSFPYSERSSLLPVSFWKRALATAAIPLMATATLRAQNGEVVTRTFGGSSLVGVNSEDYSLGFTSTLSDTRNGHWTLKDTANFRININGALILGDTVNTGGGTVGTGTFTQEGQSVLDVKSDGVLYLGSYGKGIYNLNGGTLYIGGSSLKAGYDNQAGGAGKFDPKSTGTPTGGYEFNLGGGTLETISALTTAVDARLISGTVSTINTFRGDATWNGSFSGSGTLVKTGARTLNLSGSGNDLGNFAAHQGSTVQTRGNTLSGIFYVGSKYPAPALSAANAGFTLEGGSLSISSTLFAPPAGGEAQPSLIVGDAAEDIGVMTQKAGTTVNIVGMGAGGAGPGANLTLGNLGGNGTYNLEGGGLFLNKSSLILGKESGSTGLLSMSGGSLDLTNGSLLRVGAGTGTLTQTGGVITVGTGSTFTPAGPAGATYNLDTGGLLWIGGTSLVAGDNLGKFNLGGGTIETKAALTTAVNANLVADTISTINTAHGDAEWSGKFTGSGGLLKTGTGKLTLSGSGTTARQFGGFNAHQGSTVQTAGDTASSTFMVGSSYAPTGAGALGDANASFTLEGGSLTVSKPVLFPAFAGDPNATFVVGDESGDTGLMTQKAGTTVNIPGPGANALLGAFGGKGTYNLEGGGLNLDNSSLILGNSAGGTGLLTMTGGTMNLTNGAVLFTGDGTGTLTQTGSDINVDAASRFIPSARAGATYNLNTGGILRIGGESLQAGDSAGHVNEGKFNLGGGSIEITSGLTTAVNANLVSETISYIHTPVGNAAVWSGNLSGGGLSKTGPASLTLSGNLTYTGTTRVEGNGSTLRLKDNFDSGDLAAATTGDNVFVVNTGAVLILEQNETPGSFGRNVQGGGQLRVLGSGDLTLTGSNTHTGGTIIGDPVTPGGTVTVDLAPRLGGVNGEVVVNKSTLNILGDGTEIALNIRGAVSGGVIKANGTLKLGSDGHQIDTRATIDAAGFSVYLFADDVYAVGSQSASVKVGGITLATGGRVIAPGGGVNVRSDGQSGTPSAVISASGSADIDGKVVAGDPAAGDSSGYVLIQGPTGSGEKLRLNGPLFGNYIVTGNTSLAAGSSAGFSPGQAFVGASGSPGNVEQASPLIEVWGTDRGPGSTGYDATDVVNGSLSYSGVITLTFNGGGYSPAAGDTFDLVRLSGSSSTFTAATGTSFDFAGAPLPGGLSWDTSDFFSNANGDRNYTIAVVPETSATTLLLLSAAGLTARRRRSPLV